MCLYSLCMCVYVFYLSRKEMWKDAYQTVNSTYPFGAGPRNVGKVKRDFHSLF